MSNNLALDVVIGLIFIYLLYSLLATVIAEIIATKLGLRARNLKEAMDRMLSDERQEVQPNGAWYKAIAQWLGDKIFRIWDSLRFMKNPDNPIINNFYNHPEIKYLGSSGVFKNPSSFKAVSFSKTVLYLLNGSGIVDADKIDAELRNVAPKVLGKETAEYVLCLWEDSERNIVKFRMQLEAWFERTMEQATEWYKRKIQVILLLIGFLLAWGFNVDTITIVHTLSKDKDAREQMVKMTTAYLESNLDRPEKFDLQLDSNDSRSYTEKMDSLLAVKSRLEADIESAGTILGFGSWLPDSVQVRTDGLTQQKIYNPTIEASLLSNRQKIQLPANGYISFTTEDKMNYLWRILCNHFIGFLLTAIAISLGAPFWFDLLNKMVKLRTSVKQPTASTNTNSDNTVHPSDSE